MGDFQFDPVGTRFFYNGDDGSVVNDPGDWVTRSLNGTRGSSSEARPSRRDARRPLHKPYHEPRCSGTRAMSGRAIMKSRAATM